MQVSYNKEIAWLETAGCKTGCKRTDGTLSCPELVHTASLKVCTFLAYAIHDAGHLQMLQRYRTAA